MDWKLPEQPRINDIHRPPAQLVKITLTRSNLVGSGHLSGIELHNGSLDPVGAAPVHQLLVHHRRLSVGRPVEVDHRHPRFVGPDHPRLHNLVGYQLFQHKSRDILVILGGDVGQVAFNCLEKIVSEVNRKGKTRGFTWNGRLRKSVRICRRSSMGSV